MDKREKAIKGLECCRENHSCAGCPYEKGDTDSACITDLERDALEMLKAHTPRVIDVEEIPDLDYDAPVPLWMERRCGDVDWGCDPVIVTQADENGFEYVYADGTAANEDGAETIAYNTEINGYVSCRLRDFEPTNEQRMETPWKPQSTIHPAGTTEGVR